MFVHVMLRCGLVLSGVMTDMFSEFTTHVQLSKDKPFTAMALNLVASFSLVFDIITQFFQWAT